MAAPAPFPFEDPRRRLGPRVAQTLRMAGRTPMAAYEALPRGRGLGAPWRLKLLLSAPAYLCLTLGLGLAHLALLATSWSRPEPLPAQALRLCPALALVLLVAGPLVQGALMILGGLVLHALLWAFRGAEARVGLRQTLRAAGYTQAVVGLLTLVPILGVAAYPAGRMALGLGLARLHRTDPWRGLAAAWTQAALTFLTALALLLAGAFWLARQDESSREIQLPPAELEPLPERPAPNFIHAGF